MHHVFTGLDLARLHAVNVRFDPEHSVNRDERTDSRTAQASPTSEFHLFPPVMVWESVQETAMPCGRQVVMHADPTQNSPNTLSESFSVNLNRALSGRLGAEALFDGFSTSETIFYLQRSFLTELG